MCFRESSSRRVFLRWRTTLHCASNRVVLPGANSSCEYFEGMSVSSYSILTVSLPTTRPVSITGAQLNPLAVSCPEHIHAFVGIQTTPHRRVSWQAMRLAAIAAADVGIGHDTGEVPSPVQQNQSTGSNQHRDLSVTEHQQPAYCSATRREAETTAMETHPHPVCRRACPVRIWLR